jgi:hypothetical protein
MAPGGIVVVDDCRPSRNFDGALQAYQEFCKQHRIEQQIVANKLGILKK